MGQVGEFYVHTRTEGVMSTQDTARLGYALMFLVVAILHMYNARRYATLIRASFFITGVLFLTFSAAIAFMRIADPLFALFNFGLLSTLILALIIVQIIIALNGWLDPLRRRKGE